VIHQTWFEDLSVERYPQLARVQSSWKNAGYAYRFYTDSDAREFIATNFPTRFLEAYDALVPGAFKVSTLVVYTKLLFYLCFA
jgi:mannosyltransferase OCH1-like enzyme